MPEEYRIVAVKPTGAQINALRLAVGWKLLEEGDFQRGLDGSLFAVCAFAGDEPVACARVVGDGRTVFYVQDVIVRPEYQGCGVGRAMMERVMEFIAQHACEGAVVGLMAAKGKEGFYEKFGFKARPNENDGPGMMQRWGNIY
jgi:GNAT superfamily N-acetyltransferase